MLNNINIMKAVLVTGGGGFLGYNLIDNMLRTQAHHISKIIVIDNFITSSRKKIQNYIDKFNLHDKIYLIEADICEETVMSRIKREFSTLDEIFHLASIASPPLYKKYPLETLDVGYIGTKNILNLCLHYKCKMLYASTSEVYGDVLEHPQKETYYGNVNTIGERSCYDESKRIGETLVSTYSRMYGLDTRITRIFNTYGPYMDIGDGRIVTEIIRCMLLGKPLTVYGNGTQTRSLNYVDDTIDMMIKVMNSDYKKPVNVGSDREVSVNELIEIVKNVYQKLTGKIIHIECVYKTIDVDDPKLRRPDLEVYKREIGDRTFTTLESGVSKTITYFKNFMDLLYY
jgi:nucleoside-diphosphate-sugar epimerase